MKLHHLVAIAAATCFAGIASAQTPPIGQPSQSQSTTGSGNSSSSDQSGTMGSATSTLGDTGAFSKLDKDRDGSVTKKEAASNKDLAKQWDTLDANKDGKLDQGEFAQFEASGSASGSGASASGSTRSSGKSSSSSTSSDTQTERPKY